MRMSLESLRDASNPWARHQPKARVAIWNYNHRRSALDEKMIAMCTRRGDVIL